MSYIPKSTQARFKRRLPSHIAISLVLVIPSILFTLSPVIANPEVIANSEQVRFEGTGGLILPGKVKSDTRNMVANCRDCAWKMTPVCIPSQEGYCDALTRSCPGLIDHVMTWFRPSGGEWIQTGNICLTSNRIATINGAEQQIAEDFTRYVPDLVPQCWPESGVITNLPYICASGQPGGVHRWSHEIAGFEVSISATPTWVWGFGSSTLVTKQPGGPYPDLSVSHVFTRVGVHEFPISTVWRGEFTVDGLGPFAIESDLRQRVQWQVNVGQARARLIELTSPRG